MFEWHRAEADRMSEQRSEERSPWLGSGYELVRAWRPAADPHGLATMNDAKIGREAGDEFVQKSGFGESEKTSAHMCCVEHHHCNSGPDFKSVVPDCSRFAIEQRRIWPKNQKCKKRAIRPWTSSSKNIQT